MKKAVVQEQVWGIGLGQMVNGGWGLLQVPRTHLLLPESGQWVRRGTPTCSSSSEVLKSPLPWEGLGCAHLPT